MRFAPPPSGLCPPTTPPIQPETLTSNTLRVPEACLRDALESFTSVRQMALSQDPFALVATTRPTAKTRAGITLVLAVPASPTSHTARPTWICNHAGWPNTVANSWKTQTPLRSVARHPTKAFPEIRLARCMSQNVRGIAGAWHFLHFNAIALDRSVPPKLPGPGLFYLPGTCAEQHSLACTGVHT